MSDKLNLPPELRVFYDLAIGPDENVYPPFQKRDIINLCKVISEIRDRGDRLKRELIPRIEEEIRSHEIGLGMQKTVELMSDKGEDLEAHRYWNEKINYKKALLLWVRGNDGS